jgi:PAS domain S-box-containing protein
VGDDKAIEPGEYRRALSALEESERRYRDIFETNPATKLVIDPDTGAIIDANEAACTFYGWAKSELCRKRITDINTLPAERVQQEMERARNEKRLFFNFKHRIASGEIRDVEIYTGPVRSGGRTLLHSIVIDVTERKRLQEQLLQAQRMDAMGRMAGGVAHDFNNLLTVMLTCVELVRKVLPERHAALGPIEEIESAARRGAEVTQQLLALARKRVVEPEVVEPSTLIDLTIGLLRRLIGEHIELQTEFAPGAWMVEVDPGQFEQVLVNLAVNARDAMATGGRLRITTGNAEIASSSAGGPPPGRYVRLSVADTGTGMEPEVLARIFEPFFSTKPPGQGTGLGLSTVFGIVNQAGGHTVVESTPRAGSTFHVYLPAVDRPQSPPSTPTRVSPPTPGEEVVLVVEDDVTIRNLLCEVLRDAGYTVLSAANGIEALNVARKQTGKIHLLVTDVVMPKLGGVELVRQIRAERGDLAVLFMSGYPSDLSDEPGGTRAALDAMFLPKPFSPDELERHVRMALAERRSS